MSGYDYDLFVIGAGSGGVRASRTAAACGARVAICESSRIGGTCVIRGCIPKKLLAYAAHYCDDFEDAVAYGWHSSVPTFDWPKLISNKDTEIDRLNGVYINLLKSSGVEIHEGHGRLLDEHTVAVGEKAYTAETILVATGGRPWKPSIPGAEHAITSDEAFHLEDLPRRIMIVGGGYIAVEFAGIFTQLGVETVMAIRGEELLRGFDSDLRVQAARALRDRGVEIHTRCNVEGIQRDHAGCDVRLDNGMELSTDLVMFATGRVPNTDGLGLEAAGVEMGKQGEMKVDRHLRTSQPNIYALGDVTDRLQLTPVALHEAMCFVKTVFQDTPTSPDHENVATAVFCQPPIGTVGLTEEEAREQYQRVDIYKTRFRPLKHTLTKREEFTTMKLLVDPDSDRVIGAHMIGDDAPEIIQGIAIAVKCGATKAQFDATIGIHPTAAEEFVTMRVKEPEPEPVAAETPGRPGGPATPGPVSPPEEKSRASRAAG